METRIEVEISHRTRTSTLGEYNGILEHPKIILGYVRDSDTFDKVENILSHELIHWILHRDLNEDYCAFWDNVPKGIIFGD